MGREDIDILVINRNLSDKDDERSGLLDEHIRALMARGYSVTESEVPTDSMDRYDIVIAHPGLSSVGELISFHNFNPFIPLVMISLYKADPSRVKRFNGFNFGNDGIYQNYAASAHDTIKLVKWLTGKMGKR